MTANSGKRLWILIIYWKWEPFLKMIWIYSFFADTVDDAYKFLTKEIVKAHLQGKNF